MTSSRRTAIPKSGIRNLLTHIPFIQFSIVYRALFRKKTNSVENNFDFFFLWILHALAIAEPFVLARTVSFACYPCSVRYCWIRKKFDCTSRKLVLIVVGKFNESKSIENICENKKPHNSRFSPPHFVAHPQLRQPHPNAIRRAKRPMFIYFILLSFAMYDNCY